ncbi:MAG TPA: D-alanyl-D-alanine carboxypeptidase/D-alanyl-D-alanine-endopeptidase [Gemmatimonadaceae bacterium]|nr:D-alanyl-D-alanine carboxypeptidase/D-alanyl-D-alanine-endopeptidase [Gemmatimonadaceae bacterium]
MRRTSTALVLIFFAGACHPRTAARPAIAAPVARNTPATLRRSLDSIAAAPAFRNANWGMLVVDTLGDTVYSHNAGKLFMPASNMKLLTTSVALAQLGPDFRYRTVVVAHGAYDQGTLRGDLGVIGRGDPTVSDHMQHDAMLPLRAVAESLYAHGLRHVQGRVIAEGNAFPDPVLGFGWAWDDLESSYSAPTDELLFNEGFSTVTLRGGAEPGDSVTVAISPAHSFPVVHVDVTTVAKSAAPISTDTGTARRSTILVRKDTVADVVLVSGTIAAGDSVTLMVTQRDPDAAYVAALREAMRARGIAVDGEVYGEWVGAPPDTLATLISPPLRDILPVLLKPSQNQMAEMLFKTLGLERGKAGTAVEARGVIETQLAAWGAAPDGFVVRDGSGLSRYDYVSPETIIHILAAMRRAPTFDLFYNALPIAGVDGTLKTRMRGTPAEANVHAKTGSVAQARSLSGFVRTAGGEPLMFSLLANNWSVPGRDVERAQDSIAVWLARLHRP